MRIELFAIVAVTLLIFLGFFYFTNNDVNYKITLVDGDIPAGTNALINYEIINGQFSGEKTNAKLYYYILGEGRKENQFEDIDVIQSLQNIEGDITVPTSNLPPGKYTIRTELEYFDLGKGYIKFLTLDIIIY